VTVQSWTNGRAWIAVRATSAWPGGSLFGDLGVASRRIALPDGSTAYVNAAGDRVAVHSPGFDAVVLGSANVVDLVAAAGSLGVPGREAPALWTGGAATRAEARTALRTLILLPEGQRLRRASIRIQGAMVILDAMGAGATAIEVVEFAGGELPPPDDPDARVVVVRGVPGRYQPAVGELAWVADGTVIALRSTTLPLPALVALANGMHP
jgi:hypothetical protein